MPREADAARCFDDSANSCFSGFCPQSQQSSPGSRLLQLSACDGSAGNLHSSGSDAMIILRV
ncbi:MAG TPA: hypothetical protein DDX19_16520 [Rhodopirellula baltica]|nr:hypothetical protein [Rhodopirellula baltica]